VKWEKILTVRIAFTIESHPMNLDRICDHLVMNFDPCHDPALKTHKNWQIFVAVKHSQSSLATHHSEFSGKIHGRESFL
jgi:hypothetical protein